MASSLLIRGQSTRISVLRVCMSQIGDPSINLLSRIERLLINLQLRARVLMLSSEISSQPSMTNVLMKGLFARIGCSFLSSMRTSILEEMYGGSTDSASGACS